MKDMERMYRLLRIAEQDANYLAWKKDYEACGKKFERFVKWCPKKVQFIFCAYRDCGKMMHQRLINIACANMEFVDVLQEERNRPTGEKKES